VIARACRNHWNDNHAAAVIGQQPEGIHQFRVGLRRFRTALTLFRKQLPEQQYTWMRGEAKALGDLLSRARDLDVFLNELAPRNGKSAKMIKLARQSREDAQGRVTTMLTGARYRRFLNRLDMWLEGKGWLADDADAGRPAKEFARSELNRRLAKIQKRVKNVAGASPQELHDLRIAIKKLRYGLEFFRSLLPERRAARLGRLLKSLQDSLGRLNDLEVAERTIGTLASRANSDAARKEVGRAGSSLAASFKPLAKSAQPEAAKIADRLRAQRPL
jgi:CHAD domain-containing protein